MAGKTVETREPARPVADRRFGTDWFELELPDLFRWFEGRRPLPMFEAPLFPDRIRIEQKMVEGELVVRAEVPGIDPDTDATVEVGEGLLRIMVERKRSMEEPLKEGEKETGWRTEFHYGSLTRTVPVPKGITAKDVKATYTDGILEIRMPMPTAPEGPERVTINRT